MYDILIYLISRIILTLKQNPVLYTHVNVFTPDNVELIVFNERYFEPPDFVGASSIHIMKDGNRWKGFITDGEPVEQIHMMEDAVDIANFLHQIKEHFDIPIYDDTGDGRHK